MKDPAIANYLYQLALTNPVRSTERVQLFARAADHGHRLALNYLGWSLRHGRGVDRDLTRAFACFQTAATPSSGDISTSQLSTSDISTSNVSSSSSSSSSTTASATTASSSPSKLHDALPVASPPTPPLPQQKQQVSGGGTATDATEIMTPDDEEGMRHAQNNLGLCYQLGEGVAQDLSKAVHWYREAAERGHPQAQHNLALCYQHGWGVAQDAAQAVHWYRLAADQGMAEAQSALGWCYEEGLCLDDSEGVCLDDSEGVCLDDADAVDGNKSERKSERESESLQRSRTAVRWYRRAAEAGCAEAQARLGWCYLSGKGVEQRSATTAFRLFTMAVQQQQQDKTSTSSADPATSFVSEEEQEVAEHTLVNALAVRGVAWCHEHRLGVKEDAVAAAAAYRAAARLPGGGDARALLMLGRCYREGRGIDADPHEALSCFRRAAELGLPLAQYTLAQCYQLGDSECECPVDAAQAVHWYRMAAAQGLADAQFALAQCLANGWGVERADKAAAAHWYRLAAEQGHAVSQTKLGVLYQLGSGSGDDSAAAAADQPRENRKEADTSEAGSSSVLPRDLEQAVYWHRRAADQGLAEGQFMLGVCYQSGWGLVKDLASAAELYASAAQQGLPLAQYNLAMCYQHGWGVATNQTVAAQWYKRAADQGLPEAQYNLAVCCQNGHGLERNLALAAQWYRRAAANGHQQADAQRLLCEIALGWRTE